jgi:hypothetical protein
MYVAVPDWLAVVEDEYLSTFIRQGGAAVKCVVAASPEQVQTIVYELQRLSERLGYHFSLADAATTRIHMIEQLFFHLARGVPWDALTAGYLRELLQQDGFMLPTEVEGLTYANVAYINSIPEPELRRRVRSLLRDHISADYAMAREFRIAMLVLCQARLDNGPSEQEQAAAVISWLRGELRLISALKFARIFQRIGRHNARDMLLSLAHWLRLLGRPGLVLALDISRYLADRRTFVADSGLFYSLSATLDAYEVIRQFIDATDELEGCFIAVVAPTQFLSDATRGLARYDALKLRVWDEVRDRRIANPLSGLVRLQAEAEAVAR